MGASALVSAGGAALRPIAGRSLTHIRPQLRATSAAAPASRSATSVTTAAHSARPSQHFSAWASRRMTPPSSSALSSTPALALAHRRLKSTTTTAHETRRPPKRKSSSFISPRFLPVLILIAIGGIAWDSQWLFPSTPSSNDPAEQTALGAARKFVPFDVVAREQVSPTSFILTLKAPRGGSSNLASVSSLWDIFDLWCVEVKQPQIQVAREYTPLPPAPGSLHNNENTIRLYVRAVRGGEVSTYLSRQTPPSSLSDSPAVNGDTVELRGPHGEFDLRSRLGGRGDRVVFLAGGTGIASALQAAHAVLPLPDAPSMTIFWAVRSRDEIQDQRAGHTAPPPPRVNSSSTSSWSQWNPFSTSVANKAGSARIQAEALLSADTLAAPSPISRELLALKVKYGDRLDVRVVVDQEGTTVREADLSAALALQGPKTPHTTTTTTPSHAVEGCKFHSQAAHVGMVDGAPNAGKRSLIKQDHCACSADDAAPRGKNLFVVSGPEGFVQAYAGAKLWRDGGQLQGPVGGMLGAMQRRNSDILKDWIVLKL
ncbi:oxidoreductase FAD-binding domain-containing protein [Colletotrichum orchidophilum]|uniref:Oxidoreductase FAD-binding domain-containing protein n=1 Tax=Colletotrichum orchidophilum TaxID=1209926 RepID=A0A1G4APP6_9PEZI|nr:oxidoreductase FAD-binding domain-containing protein [Colletotrichum orchidophilum]OHE91065.1 oxidoreductase FAD-binding domain-containing protein [Colletotrichum orchidophilum]